MAKERSPTLLWKNNMEFLMATLGAGIGLGNLWRFPYQCYWNGGGAFLVPYLLMVMMMGFPLVLADLAMAQYGQRGTIAIWDSVPLMSGLGWSMAIRTILINPYYTVIVSLGPLFMFASFRRTLPWASCDNFWNTPSCRSIADVLKDRHCQNATNLNGSISSCSPGFTTSDTMNQTLNVTSGLISSLANTTAFVPTTPSEEYFHNYIYQLSSGIGDLGTVRWPLLLSYSFVLAITFLYLCFGLRSWGLLSYFTTLLPYVVLIAFLIYASRLSGSKDGIIYFLLPKWENIATHSVWADAAVQVTFSLGGGGGFLLNLGCKQRFKNNCVKNAMILTISDTLTSIFCGIVIFAIIGVMTYDFGTTIDKVLGHGAGLTIIVYADMLTRLDLAPLWSVIFNFMILSLGIGSVVTSLNLIQTNIMDFLPIKYTKGHWPRLIAAILVCAWLLFGLVYVTQGGMYVLQMIDGYVSICGVFSGLLKTITYAWIYGIDRLSDNVFSMTGWRLPRVYWIVYKYLVPTVLSICLGLRFTEIRPLRYGSYIFPSWCKGVSWIIVAVALSVIPIVALYKLFFTKRDLTLRQRLRELTSPVPDWGPTVLEDKMEYQRGGADAVELAYLKPI